MLSGQFASTNAAAAKLKTQLKEISTLAKGGALMFGGGLALAAPFIYAIDKAAELQKQMIGIQIASRGSVREMDAMRAAIEKVAGVTIFSNIDVAKMAKLIATGTGLSAPQVTALLPAYAQFADVQTLMKGTPYSRSVTDAIRLAHTAQHYDPESLQRYLDLLTKASFIVPGSLGEIGHALKYSQGMAKTALGIDDTNMVLLTSLLNRLGFAGSRGGTNLLAALTRTIPGVFGSGLLTGKSGEALTAMGMVDAKGHSKFFRDGKFDAFAWMGGLGEYVQREFARNPEAIARQNIMTNFQHAFGVQGSRVASLLSSPQAIEQFRQIGEIFAQYGGVESVQKRFANESVAQQWMNAKTNFVSAMTELGYTLLPLATRALTKLNHGLQVLIDWLTKHQTAAKYLAYAFLSLSAAMLFGGTVLLLSAGFSGLGIAMSAAAAGVGLLLPALGGLAAFLGGGAAGVAAAFAGYGAGSLVNKLGPGGDLGGWLGGKIYEMIHPYQPAYVATGGGGRAINVHTQINMDGRKVATATSRHIEDFLGSPQTGLSVFDGTMSLTPAGGVDFRR